MVSLICNFISRICARFCNKIIAVSQAIKRALIDQGITESKIEVIHNGIDFDSTFHNKITQKHSDVLDSSEYSCKIFAHIGQFVPWKKQHLFLKAVSIATHQIPDAKFWLVGDDVFGKNQKNKSQLERHITINQWNDVVNILGWQDEMERIWERISFLVHTADR